MVQRMRDSEEALRWKRKFLDALEDHELREKSLSNRIRLLRRGLLGVSLAGDGHDSQLDQQLADLRKSLRNDDREVGLELLLEKIEKSILRLDNEKTQSNVALREAFTSSLAELEQLPLPGTVRRQLKKFSRSLSARLEDPQQQVGLIRQFIQILREAIQAMIQQEQARELAEQNDANQTSGGSFWQRLFAPADPAELADATEPEIAVPPPPEPARLAPLVAETDSPEEPVSIDRPEDIPPQTARPDADPPEEGVVLTDLAEFEEVDEEDIAQAQASVSLEGEVLRDRSGLAEPAFSYIAGHVEPLLLRILESIHISAESFALADAIRRNILKGLNWYDFVAVLEEILKILRSTADEQREGFQGFLAEVNESLAQVQAFVDNSKRKAEQASATDATMEAQVREQVDGISRAVQSEDADLDVLKHSVQTQIGAILNSLDGFRVQRQHQDKDLAGEMHQLVERIGALENESRELRMHLARQEQVASTDTLTELPNRDSYNKRIKVLLDAWREGPANERRGDDRALCLAVADVDHFKAINDTYGHLAGDKVLKIMAREMSARLRDKDFVARYGGEEFVIILPDTRPADAEHVLNKLREGIGSIPFHFKEVKVAITVSFGLVVATRDDTPDSVFERADQALYQAKDNGRNQVYRVR